MAERLCIYESFKSLGTQIPIFDDLKIAGSPVLNAGSDKNNECTAQKQKKEWIIPVD